MQGQESSGHRQLLLRRNPRHSEGFVFDDCKPAELPDPMPIFAMTSLLTLEATRRIDQRFRHHGSSGSRQDIAPAPGVRLKELRQAHAFLKLNLGLPAMT